MDSAQLNEAIEKLSDNESFADNHGKVIPYIGWYWREVDFNKPITLGHCGYFAGFMENNKWDYPEIYLSEEQSKEIRSRLEVIVANPLKESIGAFRGFLNDLWGENEKPEKPNETLEILKQLSGKK